MLSAKLFTDFYYKIKNNIIESINFSPTIIVFMGPRWVNSFINQLKMNNIYYNQTLFDTRYIFYKESQVKDFIDGKQKEESDLTFDLIDNLDQLILPNYFSYLIEDTNIPEIKIFRYHG